jgi:glucose-1-phosphate adenylyltransferase
MAPMTERRGQTGPGARVHSRATTRLVPPVGGEGAAGRGVPWARVRARASCSHLPLASSPAAIILGGGAGSRLMPLTKSRAKPAVPIGGAYRLIDVPMSNCINSGLSKIYILTQARVCTCACGKTCTCTCGPHRPPSPRPIPPRRRPRNPTTGVPTARPCAQFNSTSLNRHLSRAYNMGSGVRSGGDGFVEVLAATQVRWL